MGMWKGSGEKMRAAASRGTAAVATPGRQGGPALQPAQHGLTGGQGATWWRNIGTHSPNMNATMA